METRGVSTAKHADARAGAICGNYGVWAEHSSRVPVVRYKGTSTASLHFLCERAKEYYQGIVVLAEFSVTTIPLATTVDYTVERSL